MFLKLLKKREGQGLIDILVGLALVTLGIGLATILVLGGQSVLVDRDNTTRARALAREGIEGANLILKKNWSGIADGNYGLVFASGTWQFASTSDSQDFFTRQISVSSSDSNQRLIKSRVVWQASPQRNLNVEFVTLVTNWPVIIETGGDTGGGAPSGNWQNPRSLGSADIGAGNSATDIDVINGIIYLSSAASVKSNYDIHVFDASNPAAPVKLDEIDVDAYAAVSIDYSGNYVYSASTGVIPDLKIVSAADPHNLSLTSEYNVITFVDAKSTFKSGSIVFLGVKKTSFNGEFFTINVSNPINPSQLDVFEINGDVNKIFVKNNIAYVANSRDDKELFILNVSNPGDIREAGFLNVSGTTDAVSVFVTNSSRVFLGVGNILYIVDATNPATPFITGSIDVGGIVNDIYAAGTLVFLATSNSNREFQVVNITNPAQPVLHSSLNFPQVATGIDYENNIVYVSVRSNDGLRIITSTP